MSTTIEATVTKQATVKRVSAKEREKQAAIEELRRTLKPGDTVHTVLRRVSASGMSRRIDLYKLDNGDMRYLTGLVAKACGYSFPRQGEGLRVGGCGMDMGFAVVYDLSHALFPKGFAVVERTACKHCQDRPGFDGLGRTCRHCGGTGVVETPKCGRNGDMSGWDSDGGYALNQRWI